MIVRLSEQELESRVVPHERQALKPSVKTQDPSCAEGAQHHVRDDVDDVVVYKQVMLRRELGDIEQEHHYRGEKKRQLGECTQEKGETHQIWL